MPVSVIFCGLFKALSVMVIEAGTRSFGDRLKCHCQVAAGTRRQCAAGASTLGEVRRVGAAKDDAGKFQHRGPAALEHHGLTGGAIHLVSSEADGGGADTDLGLITFAVR